MRVYVTTQGASIVKEGGHLLVRCGKDIHHTVFVHKMNQLILCGNITLTPPARNVLFKNNIDTVFLVPQQNLWVTLGAGRSPSA